MHMQKFDYYSVDHTWGEGGEHMLQMYYILWGNPTSARIPACKLSLGIAICESLPCLLSKESTFSCHLLHPCATIYHGETAWWKSPFHIRTNNLCLFWLVNHCIRDSCQPWLSNGVQSDEPQLWW